MASLDRGETRRRGGRMRRGEEKCAARESVIGAPAASAGRAGVLSSHGARSAMREDATIEETIAACAAGDRTALRALYEREAAQMLGVALRILKRRSLAEDALQDAFLRIWSAAASFDGAAGQGRGWIYAILRNRALNMLRGEARVDLVDDVEPLGLADPQESPEERVARMSDASALKRCLETLDAARRRILVLAYTEGLSQGEIAGRLGLPLGTVKSWTRRSLLALRECLG